MAKRTLNVKSPKYKQHLYGTLGLPIQYKLDPSTRERRPSTDYHALLNLTKKSTDPSIRLGMDITALRTRIQVLGILPCEDGRMRWSTNLVGTETGRITTSRSNISVAPKKRSGTNMQAIPDDWDLADDEHPLTRGIVTGKQWIGS